MCAPLTRYMTSVSRIHCLSSLSAFASPNLLLKANTSNRCFSQMAQVNGANTRLWVVSILAALSSFLFGYAMSCLNPCFKDADKATGSMLWDIDLSTQLQQVATALMLVGAWIGCSFSGEPCLHTSRLRRSR